MIFGVMKRKYWPEIGQNTTRHQKDVHGCRFGVFIKNLECSGYLSSVFIAYVEHVFV